MSHLKQKNCFGDYMVTAIIWFTVIGICMAFFWFMSDILIQGSSSLSVDFFIENPRNSGRAGGIFSIIVSTSLILLVCLLTVIPLALGTAIFLAEFASLNLLFTRFVRQSLDILAGIPSIIFGLFGSVFFCNILGLGFSILSGGLTLSCMVLPILIRSIEEGFRSLDNDYRLNATALGFSKTSMVFRFLLPMATPGIIVGLILGIGRAIAETAALIFTSGYVDRTPSSLLDSGRSLSIHIFDLSMNIPGGNANAYASALVLILFILLINLAVSFFSKRWLQRNIL